MIVKDKNGNIIKPGVEFMYKAIQNKPPFKSKIIERDGELWITWEDGIEHLLDDFWNPDFDEELSEIIN